MEHISRPSFKFRSSTLTPGTLQVARPRANPLTLLVVQDRPDPAAVIAFVLRNEGHVVWTATTSREALRLAAERDFDLVISDLQLPDADGCDLMAELHYHHNLNGIALTELDGFADAVHLSTSGFVDNVTKPIRFNELIQAVDYAARTRRAL